VPGLAQGLGRLLRAHDTGPEAKNVLLVIGPFALGRAPA
jgi:hypothetical protein